MMDDYNFLADLLGTFRALNDGIKALIVTGFYGVLTMGLLAVTRRVGVWISTRHRIRECAPGSMSGLPGPPTDMLTVREIADVDCTTNRRGIRETGSTCNT